MHVGDRGVLQDRALGDELAVLDAHARDLHADAGVEARGQAGADLEAEQAAAEQRVAVAAVGDDLRHRVDDRLREALGALGAEHLRRAVAAERGAELVGQARLVADHDGVALAAELAGEPGALGDGAERVLVERAVVVQRVDQDRAHASSFLSSSHDDDLLDRLVGVLVLDDLARLLGGGRLEVGAVRAGVVVADAAGLDADVAGGLGVERLLLRAHDRLQRRVARLVDRVADGDHGRQLDEHGVVAVLGLALAAQRAVLDVDLDHLRERGHPQVVGDDRADRVALAVVGLLAEQHEVGRLGLQRLGERVAGAVDVRAGERLVGQVQRAVRAERDGLVERAHRGLRAHRHRDDLVDLAPRRPP